MNLPTTRPSLLIRIRDSADRDAWFEFVEIYRPVIVRLAVAKGMQQADAEDLCQKVLIAVAEAIERFDPDGAARFRTWLKRITDNAVLNAITRARPDRASGDEGVQFVLDQQPDRDGPDSALLKTEYRREILHWAAKEIRDEFTETTWKAFWLTAVEARPAEEVGQLLGRNRGSIYAARSRVMRRLIEKIDSFEDNEPRPSDKGTP